VQRSVVRGQGAPGESERRREEPSALVEHAPTLPGRWRYVNVWGD
jgi:hypothetical protein